MTTAILKYNAGNVFSVQNALRRLGEEAIVTDDPVVLDGADRVIIPGVGEASTAMEYLRTRGLDETVRNLTQPVLGVCLGLQIFCAYSEENDTECLGIFPQVVKRFTAARKVPHMGWNALDAMSGPLFEGVGQHSYVYFVHSYFAEVGDATVAESGHAEPFSAALQKGNFMAVQFHPEKSAEVGAQVLKNFLTQ